jgi:hypothetical protein
MFLLSYKLNDLINLPVQIAAPFFAIHTCMFMIS